MSIFKSIGKILTAPVRGVGHALKTSGIPLVNNVGGALEQTGNAFAGKGSFFQDLGRAGQEAAPVAALVPGVGPLAAGGLSLGGNFLEHGKKTKVASALGKAAIPAAESYLLGGQGVNGIGGAASKIGGVAKTIGKAVSAPNVLGNAAGKIDLGKVLGLGTAAMNIAGANSTRKSNQTYLNSQIDARNALLSKVLAGGNSASQKYNFAPEF